MSVGCVKIILILKLFLTYPVSFNTLCIYIPKHLLDQCETQRSCKICSISPSARQSACLSGCLSDHSFQKKRLIGFSAFGMSARFYKSWNLTWLNFLRKSSVIQFSKKRSNNGHKTTFCCSSSKFLLLYFSEIYQKWKTILLSIFQSEPRIWQNSSSWVMGQNTLGTSNCRTNARWSWLFVSTLTSRFSTSSYYYFWRACSGSQSNRRILRGTKSHEGCDGLPWCFTRIKTLIKAIRIFPILNGWV